MTPKLHHVGIIMPSEEEAAEYIARMGYEEDYRGTVEKWQVLCIFLRCCGPTAIELALPCSCLVSPNPISGAAPASSMAVIDSDARIELLCSCWSRDVMMSWSGVATVTTAAAARQAHNRPSTASLPRAASRIAR